MGKSLVVLKLKNRSIKICVQKGRLLEMTIIREKMDLIKKLFNRYRKPLFLLLNLKYKVKELDYIEFAEHVSSFEVEKVGLNIERLRIYVNYENIKGRKGIGWHKLGETRIKLDDSDEYRLTQIVDFPVNDVDKLMCALVHEMGHYILSLPNKNEVDNVYEDKLFELSDSVPISGYCTKSKSEFFCENLALFIIKPNHMKKKYPRSYKIIKSILKIAQRMRSASHPK